MDKRTCDPCQTVYEQQSGPVSGFCVQCVEYLCDACIVYHRKLKASRSHVLLTGEDIPDDKAAFQMLEMVGKCSENQGEEVIYECMDHEKFLCILCAKDKHLKCKGLAEISIRLQNDTHLTKLYETEIKLIKDGDKINSLKRDIDKKAIQMNKQQIEMQEKQTSTRMRLENALKQLKKQEDVLEKIFQTKREKIDLSRKKLGTLANKNNLSSQFTQILTKYGRPCQLYIVANGQFHNMDDDIRAINEEYTDLDDVESNEFDVNTDILNLILTVEESKVLYEKASDSIDYVSEHSSTHSESKVLPVSLENENHLKERQAATVVAKEDQPPSLMNRSIGLSSIYHVRRTEDSKACDLLAVATIEARNLIVIIDYANSNLKVFNSDFTFLNLKSLQQKPCSVCVLKNGHVSVLVVEKGIYTFNITADTINQIGYFKIDSFGHNLTNYGNDLAVICFDIKFDPEQHAQASPSIQIVKSTNGEVVNRLMKLYTLSQCDKQVTDFNGPSQIFSRGGRELIVSNANLVRVFGEKCVQKWFYSRGKKLRGAAGLTSDNEGNVYVCGEHSNNIHQIFSTSYSYSRVIIPDVQRPWAIAFEKEGERLIVTSRNSNSVMTYKFQ